MSWTREEAQREVFDWIEVFYNRDRSHSTPGFMSPEEFENQSAACCECPRTEGIGKRWLTYVLEYFHMDEATSLRPGDRVDRGTRLGPIGATGIATGPHAHFGVFTTELPDDIPERFRAETTDGRYYIDPAYFLTNIATQGGG